MARPPFSHLASTRITCAKKKYFQCFEPISISHIMALCIVIFEFEIGSNTKRGAPTDFSAPFGVWIAMVKIGYIKGR